MPAVHMMVLFIPHHSMSVPHQIPRVTPRLMRRPGPPLGRGSASASLRHSARPVGEASRSGTQRQPVSVFLRGGRGRFPVERSYGETHPAATTSSGQALRGTNEEACPPTARHRLDTCPLSLQGGDRERGRRGLCPGRGWARGSFAAFGRGREAAERAHKKRRQGPKPLPPAVRAELWGGVTCKHLQQRSSQLPHPKCHRHHQPHHLSHSRSSDRPCCMQGSSCDSDPPSA